MPNSTLANAELALMTVLWDSGPATARELRERLYSDTDKAQHGTVQRLLQRLEDKEFVTRDRNLHVHVFSPLVSRKDYAGHQLESLADKLTDGSLAPLITHLIQEKKISSGELDKLRKLLANAESDAGSAPNKRKGGAK